MHSVSKRLVDFIFKPLLLVACGLPTTIALAQADTRSGAQAYKVCATCHSLEQGRNLTGPSLASLFGRKAGTVKNFLRYSDALKNSNVEWNEKTLDAWLREPAKFIPGNDMTFPGIQDTRTRRDLIAFLKTAESMPVEQRAGRKLPDLKKAQTNSIVKSIRHCGDTYFVTTGDEKVEKIWEFNLRLKTDSSDHGPAPGKPVLIGVGMRGDRAAIVFAHPGEIGALVKEQCG